VGGSAEGQGFLNAVPVSLAQWEGLRAEATGERAAQVGKAFMFGDDEGDGATLLVMF